MTPTRTIARTLALAVLGVGLVPGVAAASQKVTANKTTCTITAVAPTLKGKSLFGSATINCTAATSVTVEIGVVEVDGKADDTKVPVPTSSKTVAVPAKKAVTITTATVACLDTEPDKEEYATVVRANLSGTISAWDRTKPANNSFSC